MMAIKERIGTHHRRTLQLDAVHCLSFSNNEEVGLVLPDGEQPWLSSSRGQHGDIHRLWWQRTVDESIGASLRSWSCSTTLWHFPWSDPLQVQFERFSHL